MANLTPEQYAKLKTLKDALNGDGDALDAVIAEDPAETPVYGSDQFFFQDDGVPVPITGNTWQTVYEYDLGDTLGGRYWSELLIFWTGSATNVDYEVRFLIDDQPVSQVFSKELKDPDDTVNWNLFSEFTTGAATAINFKVQGRVSTGGSTMTFTAHRYRQRRVALT